MTTRTRIRSLGEHVGQEIRLCGWVRQRRSSGGKLHFLQIDDGTGSVQVVVKQGGVPEDQLEAARHVPFESTVIVRGLVKADSRQAGGCEVAAVEFHVLNAAIADFPIGRKEHGVGFLMDQRHLWLRSRRPQATLRIRAEIIKACRDHLDGRGFTCVDAPIFNSAAAEGTATLFPVTYFDRTLFLSQTGQLHMEAAAQALGDVYCFGPTFRAEKSKTRRHLTEFWMLEPEIAFGDLEEAMEVMESLIIHIVERTLTNCRGELEALGRDIGRLESCVAPFPRISYTDALTSLEGTEASIPWGEDFGAPQEDAISKTLDRPILVHGFPTAIKAFYMRPNPANPKVVLGCDMIAPDGYGEIIGGGERSSDLAYLEQKIAEHGLPKEAYEWYLDLRRYGANPTAGFGMGLERVVSWICDLGHVREASPFARTMARTSP
ncbi:MAG: asparagine--tRNA ligase [Planctomycetota bacterium]|nr:asparagine--tRNA ligase [Planctomycetota bacterium]